MARASPFTGIRTVQGRDNLPAPTRIETEVEFQGIAIDRQANMKDLLRFFTGATTGLAACILAASLAVAAHDAGKAQLNGRWMFNAKQSDDASHKVQEAKVNSVHGVNEAAGGGSYPGGGTAYPDSSGLGYPSIGGGVGIPVGGVDGTGGLERSTRHGTRGSVITDEQWDSLSENPKYLDIDQHSGEIGITADSGDSQTFYTDGKKHDEKDAFGKKFTTKADWDGSSLVAETDLHHSQKLTETFRLSDDGKQLYVTTVFEDSSLKTPLSIRRVYDLAKSGTK